MKLIYTHENILLVKHAQNLLLQSQVPCILKNEFAGSGAGELPPQDIWPQLWIVSDDDWESALKTLSVLDKDREEREWICTQCQENNADTFEICRQCQAYRPDSSRPAG